MTEPRVLPCVRPPSTAPDSWPSSSSTSWRVGLAFVAEGAGRWVMITIASAMVLGTVPLLRALGRRAIVLDGTRIGWRNGIVATGSWTEVDDVVLVTRTEIGTRRNRSTTSSCGRAPAAWVRSPGCWRGSGPACRPRPAARGRPTTSGSGRSWCRSPTWAEGAAEVEAWLGRR